MSASLRAPKAPSSAARLALTGGLGIFLFHLVWDIYLYGSVYLSLPPEVPLQYVASGALGMTAFEGGLGTALLGLAIHLFISLVVAGVFVAAAARLAALRSQPILGGLLYGLGVLLVMAFIVIPLSGTPKSEPGLDFWISATASHTLTVGLFLGILVQRSRIGS